MNYLSKALVVTSLVAISSMANAIPTYVSAQWDNDSISILDENFNQISSFNAGASDPNGVTSDGTLIYSGHPFSNQVIAYDFLGVEQFRWNGGFPSLQGMAVVGNELAIQDSGNIEFYDSLTGAFSRSIASPGGGTEGLGYDGTLLWAIGDSLIGVDPLTGAQVANIPNAANGCSFTGTGIADAGPGQLALGCTNGDWYVVSDADGSVLVSGNNGLNMYGLGNISAVPEPATLALMGLGLAGIGYRRKKAA